MPVRRGPSAAGATQESTDPFARVRRLIAALAALLLVGTAVVAWAHPAWPPVWVPLVLFVTAAVTGLGRAEVRRDSHASLLGVLLLAALALVGPVGAALLGLLVPWLPTPQSPGLIGRAFNSLNSGLVTLCGGVAYLLAGGVAPAGTDLGDERWGSQLLVPLCAGGAVMLVVNALNLGAVQAVSSPVSMRRAMQANLRTLAPFYVVYVVLAFLLTTLWASAGLGPLGLLLVLAPLGLAQWAMAGQAAEREVRQRTVTGIEAAVVARHPWRRGHAAWTGAVCEMVADELHMPAAAVDDLLAAVPVHDVGLLAPVDVASRLDPGLTDGQRERILQHPERGVQMLEDVEFLSPVVAVVRHHHEAWDGSGYPDGLRGDLIPQGARVLTAALTLGALACRDDEDLDSAVVAIQGLAGTRLDPAVVDVLTDLHTRGRLDEPPRHQRRGLDHDDPLVGDALADA